MSVPAKVCSTPELDRVNYFYGQTLGVREFRIEQEYFRQKIKLHNRCLHGPGVVCGLVVQEREVVPQHKPRQKEKVPCWPRLAISCGLALDMEGNELIVRDGFLFDLWPALGKADQETVAADTLGKSLDFYVSLAFRDQPLEPTRAVLPGTCGDSSASHFSKWRDSVCVRVTLQPPPEDNRCDPCCDPLPPHTPPAIGNHCCPPEGPPVLLAKVHFDRGSQKATVENSYRERYGNRATKIKNINWMHGKNYKADQADLLLKEGLQVSFTRPVQEDCIQPGVMDVLVYSGLGCARGHVDHLEGTLKPIKDGNKVTGVIFNYSGGGRDRLDPDDRIHVVLRSAFLLDECCRPLDGMHVGGWVPFEAGSSKVKHPDAPTPPVRCGELLGSHGRWDSGFGHPGVNFESWFFVEQPDDATAAAV